MVQDEFAEAGPLAMVVVVLGVPVRGAVHIWRGMVARLREPRSPAARVGVALTWTAILVAYAPSIVLYEAFAIPLVAGSVLFTGALVALAMAVGAPFLLAAAAYRRMRSST